jgi:kynureninase
VQAGREIVIMDQDEFPADLYIASGVLKQYPNKKLLKVKREELLDQINEQVAVIVISHVNYLDSTLLDIKELASKAREYGVLLLVDLAHSAGALPINLQDAGIDMAVGCTYKYLNGGPGSLGFLFVADRHLEKMPNVIQGWMGHLEPFAFNKEYHPAANIDKFAGGTPAILSLSALDVSLDLILSASLANLREKSLSLTTILGNLILEYCGELELLTPRSEARGSHVAFYHPRGYEITQALQAAKVIADYRAQGVIRFGVAPLYNNLNDIEQAVAALEKILKTKQYTDPKYQQLRKVT